ncbi:MAG TPA: recombinase family protein [Pseudobacteroides sp.]|uniref:recombinase family protein n=1 Tax=Pseudobacteroides sp. TaxID=1968840 RepID=UPI002F92C2A7
MSMVREVTIIPANKPRFSAQNQGVTRKRNVAAYARVSTDKEEQQTSYEAQVDHYTKHIKSNPEWNFAGIYSDEGISATNTKKREGFKRMIADALDGKIDLILTKSVSRFARNTVDTLTTVRKLKEKGVEVFFEKENIYTLDSKGELLITIMSSLAQEESRSMSENIQWGRRKSFADGKVSLPYSKFLGYEKGADGLPQIVESEAVIVRRIYNEFLEGKTANDIAKRLTEECVPTPGGCQNWQPHTVQSILTNEKYKGDAILQKTFTVDFLNKKKKINEGEVPQYYIENSHPAIVEPCVFEMVKEEFARRAEGGKMISCSILSGRIVCGDCGGFYGRKVWHAGSEYAKTVWHCNNKFQKRKYCSTPTLKEEAIKKAFVAAFNHIIDNKAEIFENYELCLDAITDDSTFRSEIKEIDKQCSEIETLIEKLIAANARTQLEQDEYNKSYNNYVARYDKLQKRRAELGSEIAKCAAKRVTVSAFLSELKKHNTPLADFDDRIWQATLNHMKILNDGKAVFVFRDGTELTWSVDCEVRKYVKKNST